MMGYGGYGQITRSLNGHGDLFRQRVQVGRSVDAPPDKEPDRIRVDGREVTRADGNDAMRDGHLKALAQWIESE